MNPPQRTLFEGKGSHVAVVHCKSARDRSGVMMACWLIASGKCLSASHAIQFINGRVGSEIVYTPSQLRYVRSLFVAHGRYPNADMCFFFLFFR